MTAPVFKNGEWLLPDDHDRQEKENQRQGLGGSNFAGAKARFERKIHDIDFPFLQSTLFVWS